MGFEHFFAIFDGVFGANYRSSSSGIEVAVLAAILGVILYLSLLIFAIVQKKRHSRCGWLIGVLLGGLILEGGPVILCYMAVRLLFVPISYLIYFLVTPFGLIALGGTALLLLLIRNGKFELKRFKALGVLYMAIIIAVSAGGYYIGNPLSITSNNYYEAHNGKSTEQAVEIEVGKSYLANIKERGGEYYFVFTPTKSGSYTISSDYNMRTKVKLYSESNGLLGSDEDKNTKGFSLTQNLQANQRYYICVGFIEDYHSGHFTVLLNKA